MLAPLKILIADDEALARSRLRSLLADCAGQVPNEVVGEADSGVTALQKLSQVDADLALLDIRMPGMDGMELARRIHALPCPPAIIFVTAYDAHALDAFEVQALDYLLKPVKRERLLEALSRIRARTPGTGFANASVERAFTISDRGRVWRVPMAEVLYLRAELKYVTLRTREREYVLNDALGKIEEDFAPELLRIHRNCLINRQYLVGFELRREGEETHWVAVLRDWSERLPVSRRQAHIVKEFRAASAASEPIELGGSNR